MGSALEAKGLAGSRDSSLVCSFLCAAPVWFSHRPGQHDARFGQELHGGLPSMTAGRAGLSLVDTIRISKSIETLKLFSQLSTRFPLNGRIRDIYYTSSKPVVSESVSEQVLSSVFQRSLS